LPSTVSPHDLAPFSFFECSVSGTAAGHLKRGKAMTLTFNHLEPIVALVAGVLILIVPRILNYIVALYLIIVGILGLHLIHY
jgi:hypothetical protein